MRIIEWIKRALKRESGIYEIDYAEEMKLAIDKYNRWFKSMGNESEYDDER